MEQWIDNNGLNNKTGLPSNNWTKVFEFTDDGDWAGGHTKCGGSNNTIITWGGPIAVFRWDQIPDMDVKYFNVREIQDPSGRPNRSTAKIKASNAAGSRTYNHFQTE